MKERTFSEKDKRILLKKYHQSGLALSRFCFQESISQSLFRNWVKESGTLERKMGNFVPVQLVEFDGRLFPVLVG